MELIEVITNQVSPGQDLEKIYIINKMLAQVDFMARQDKQSKKISCKNCKNS